MYIMFVCVCWYLAAMTRHTHTRSLTHFTYSRKSNAPVNRESTLYSNHISIDMCIFLLWTRTVRTYTIERASTSWFFFSCSSSSSSYSFAYIVCVRTLYFVVLSKKSQSLAFLTAIRNDLHFERKKSTFKKSSEWSVSLALQSFCVLMLLLLFDSVQFDLVSFDLNYIIRRVKRKTH